jgi:hypothetical protein
MFEFIRPGIRRHYEYQPNVLICWAAVALTLWRAKNGRQGAGLNMDTLFSRSGGERYMKMLDYAGYLNEEMGGRTDLGELPRAEAAVRRAHPQFVNTPSGLPDIWADAMFSWLGCRSTTLDSSVTAEMLKSYIRAHAPIAIFQRNPAHLQLIVGYWEADERPNEPQIILFNPERLVLEQVRTGNYDINPNTLREDRWLWAHWQQFFNGNLVGAKGWHF